MRPKAIFGQKVGPVRPIFFSDEQKIDIMDMRRKKSRMLALCLPCPSNFSKFLYLYGPFDAFFEHYGHSKMSLSLYDIHLDQPASMTMWDNLLSTGGGWGRGLRPAIKSTK